MNTLEVLQVINLIINAVTFAVIVVGFVFAYPLLQRVEKVLQLAEANATVVQTVAQRVLLALEEAKQEAAFASSSASRAAKAATKEVKAAVEQVPDKVVERISEGGSGNYPKAQHR